MTSLLVLDEDTLYHRVRSYNKDDEWMLVVWIELRDGLGMGIGNGCGCGCGVAIMVVVAVLNKMLIRVTTNQYCNKNNN